MAQQAPKAAAQSGFVKKFLDNLKSKEFRDYLTR